MFALDDAYNLASSSMTKTASTTISLIIVLCICARVEVARTQPIDKQSSATIVYETTRNIHDNLILKSTTSINSYQNFSQQRTIEAQLKRIKDNSSCSSNSNTTAKLVSQIVRTPTEFAQIKDVHSRRRRRLQRSVVPAAEALKTTINTTQEGLHSNTNSSIFVTSTPMISPLPPFIATMSSGGSGSNSNSSIGKDNPLSGYATVNYNGLIGVNGTDPYAITTESRSFALPTEIQILMCLFYGTLAFTAITSNMIVCYIVLSNQRMRTATNYFIVNLAVGDILMALLCIPFTFPANLIFQFWPFGLSLCVIVSYSQTNSVFISAYTMVAISIDKYIAIMHPMRLRMPKNQAKVIILVIWSAALLTSLPTALLSSLAPASPDLGAPPQAASTIEMQQSQTTSTSSFAPFEVTPAEAAHRSQSQYDPPVEGPQKSSARLHLDYERQLSLQPSGNSSESKISSTKASSSPSPPENLMPTHKPQQQQQDQYEEQRKYFCQESWTFWPRGKYYYSMALMVLQFVVPLFVLIVTYTRIVVVVWGKRIPGEEDNARDARMARSKRKMIKMVIFCVIAFVLTWSPFNALIVIGDIAPEIWEHHSIMYIWFITHYLAMCHTVTNPLIYIWMNNRFRAGFKQVIGDVCKFLQRLFAYLVCYCLCFGCCFNCSKQKYERVALEMDRKQRARRNPLASSGSINPYNNNGNNNHQHFTGTMAGIGIGRGSGAGLGAAGGQSSGGAEISAGLTAATYYASGNNSSNQSNSNTLGKRSSAGGGGGLDGQGNCSSSGSRPAKLSGDWVTTREGAIENNNRAAAALVKPRSAQVCKFRTDPIGSFLGEGVSRLSQRRRGHQQSEQQQQCIELEPIGMTSSSCCNSAASNAAAVSTQVEPANKGPSCPSQSAIKSPSGQKCAGLFQRRKWRQARRHDLKPSLGGERAHSSRAGTGAPKEHQTTQGGSHGAGESAAAGATKKRRRRRQTHAVCLQVTTSQFYSAPGGSKKQLVTTTIAAAAASDSGSRTLPMGQKTASGCMGRPPPNHHGATTTTTASLIRGQKKPIVYPHDCPSCRQASSSPLRPRALPLANHRPEQPYAPLLTRSAAAAAGPAAAFGHFLVDTRHSSQSTATISAQTNNTSLAISPVSSTKGVSNGTAAGDSGTNRGLGQPVSISNSSNTSASLSANGLAGDQAKDGHVDGGGGGGSRCCDDDDGDGGGEADSKRTRSQQRLAVGNQGQARNCATDDDADDNSINGHALGCRMYNDRVTSSRPYASPTGMARAASNEMMAIRFGRRSEPGGSNNLKLAVNVNDDDDHSSSCCERVSDLLQPPSGYADEVDSTASASDNFNNISNSDRSPYPVSSSRAAPSLSFLSSNFSSAIQVPQSNRHSFSLASESNLTTRTTNNNRAAATTTNGSAIDARLAVDLQANDLSGTSVITSLGANTHEDCNQSAASSMSMPSPPLNGELFGHYHPAGRGRLRHDRTARHGQSGAKRGRLGTDRFGQQRFCSNHRQTASAIEVGQWCCQSVSAMAAAATAAVAAATNASSSSSYTALEAGGMGDESDAVSSSQKQRQKQHQHQQQVFHEFHAGVNKRKLYGILGGMNASRRDSNLRGTKSRSALELMSDHLLQGRRLRRRRPDYELAAAEEGYYNKRNQGNHTNEFGDDQDDDNDNGGSDRPFSPWSGSDIEQAAAGHEDNSNSMNDHQVMEEEEDDVDDVDIADEDDEEGEGEDEKESGQRDDDGRRRRRPECRGARLMLLAPINVVENHNQTNETVGIDGKPPPNGFVQSANDDYRLASSKEKKSEPSNLNHCSTSVMARAPHYQVQSMTGTETS
uniref:Neuropeptide Y receptor n=2 Tax=Aceria tosichella TaxID=561515 RepID=A0A6G1SMQ0_9ACAR